MFDRKFTGYLSAALFLPIQLNNSLKYLIVAMSPSSRETTGSQARFPFASVMSGSLLLGSSEGNSTNRILDRDWVKSIISRASEITEVLDGLPKFTGECKLSTLNNLTTPSIKSLTKQKLRDWLPSPYTVKGLFCRA